MTLFEVRARDELLGVRFATSPVWETMAAVRTFVDEQARRYHEPWHETVRTVARRLDLDALLAMLWPNGYVPDFLTPPPTGPAPRLRDQLAQVRATPLERVDEELCKRRASVPDAELPRLDELLGRPDAARVALADQLHDAWRELVAPFWPRVRALLDRDIEQRSRTLARRGLRGVLEVLHPRIRWVARGVAVDGTGDEVVPLAGRGLVLMPSAYLWPAVTAIVDEPWQPTIVYPARGIAELWRRPAVPPEALARLLGATRALLLTTLDRPLSTSALAGLTELSAPGVSRHLLALRDAGLLASARHGHEVRYAQTALGRALLKANR